MFVNDEETAAAPSVVPEEAAEAETASDGEEGTANTTECVNFSSDHAVDPGQPEAQPPAENRRLEALTMGRVVARRRQSRASINLGDLTAGLPANRRGSINSLMSSLTCTDYGDSFFTDEDSRWLLDDLLEDLVEDHDEEDQKPICPIRRDSLSTERLMSSRHHPFHDVGMQHAHEDDDNDDDDVECSCHPSKDGHDLPPKTARPPMKPGRRESFASVQLLRQNLFDRNPTQPGRQESSKKDRPMMPPNRDASLSTLSGLFSDGSGMFSVDGTTCSSPSAAGTTGAETTGSSTISPSLDLSLKRTKAKRALFA